MHGRISSAAAKVRAAQEAKLFELGCPALPSFIWNNRPLYEIWKRYSKWLLAKRLLAYSDGAFLLELCEAELAGQQQRKQDALTAWKGRAQFPAPEVPSNKLVDFIADVADERVTFQQGLVPGQTVMLDGGVPYEWPDGDAATVARRYASDVLEGAIVAGELIKLAAKRFLSDLEVGHERGIFFDPLAARHIVQFAEQFDNLKFAPVAGIQPCQHLRIQKAERRTTVH